MHVDLDERGWTERPEAVNLARFHHEDVTRAGLEFLSVHDPETVSFADELHLVVGVSVRTWAASLAPVKEKRRNPHVAVPGADEVV